MTAVALAVVVHRPPTSLPPTPPTESEFTFLRNLTPQLINSSVKSSSSFKLSCIKRDNTHIPLEEGFSILKTDFPCERGSIWSIMAFYIFSLHIPLSFGGLSTVAEILHEIVLDPQTQALALLVIQTVELVGFFMLLRYTAKSDMLLSYFDSKDLPKKRNWLLASAFGLGFLLALVVLTSFIADRLIGTKDVSNPILKEILSSSPLSVIACTLVYCIVTPFLEETVYRGFLLTSLASTMEWQKAVVLSSAVFSAAHFSVENSLQLFVIGCVLGCSYCWSGKLQSPVLIHSLYNALTLYITFTS